MRSGTYAYPFYVVAVLMLIVVAVMGHSTGGSRRWINLGMLNLEPSEVAKLAVVLVMVRYLREEPPRADGTLQQMIIPALLLAVPAVLVLKQPDLGTALILVLITGHADFRRRTQLADDGGADARRGAGGAGRHGIT